MYIPARPDRRRRVGLLWLLLCPAVATALPEDADQPIHIQADSAELDETTGIAVYVGSVQLEQGTMKVVADRMTIHTENDEVIRVTADGKLAHYQQQPEPDAALVNADARTIVYHMQDERIELIGDARLVQQQDRFTGEHIEYDVRTRVVNAGGGTRTTAEPGRVRMTLQPRRKDGTSP